MLWTTGPRQAVMATTEGKKRASVWGRSAPALPFGQSACGGHGLRSTPPNAAGPGAAPGLLTRNTAPATLSLQAGPVRLHYYILNCPGDCRKMGVSSDHISQWDLTFMIGGDEVIQPLGERWLALFQPYAFSAVFDFETEVLHRGVPGFVAQYGSRYTSVIGESAYFGAGYNQFRFSKVALPSGKVLIDTSGPEDMRALDAGEYVSVVGLHGPLALLSCGIRGEAWRKYCAFDMESERLGEFSNKVNLYLYSDYAVREKETGLIEFTYISLTKLPSAMEASPEPPSGELLRACIDPSSLEVTFPQRVDYDSRNEIAIITDSGEVEIFPRHLFNYVPMRWGFLSRQGQNAPHSESREERVKAQQEFLDSQVGKSIPVTLYGREFNYQVRHLEIVGKNVECKRP